MILISIIINANKIYIYIYIHKVYYNMFVGHTNIVLILSSLVISFLKELQHELWKVT